MINCSQCTAHIAKVVGGQKALCWEHRAGGGWLANSHVTLQLLGTKEQNVLLRPQPVLLSLCKFSTCVCPLIPQSHAWGGGTSASVESGQPWGMLTMLYFVQLLLQSCRGMHPVNTYTSWDFSGFHSWVFRGHRNFFQHFPVFVPWHSVWRWNVSSHPYNWFSRF